MESKKIVAGLALATAAVGATLAVTALPAAAERPAVSIPGMTKDELRELCDRRGGAFVEYGSLYECYLPNMTYYTCRTGENCVIVFTQPDPGRTTPPNQQPPGVVQPTAATS